MTNGKVKKDSKVDKVEVFDENVVVKRDSEEENDSEATEKKQEVHYANKVLWTLLVLVEVFLFLKFTLEFLEANPDSVFFSFILFVTAPFMYPFERLFTVYDVTLFGYEINTLFAMFTYFLMALVIKQIIVLFRPVEGTDN